MEVVCIGRRYQVVIPKEVCRELGVGKDDELVVWIEGNRIVRSLSPRAMPTT